MSDDAWPRLRAVTEDEVAAAAAAVRVSAAAAQVPGRMPAIYLGHGAPPLLDDALWVAELAAWAGALPRPSAVLMVSAHWTQAPLTLGATEAGVPLIYDFYGFPDRYYQARYPAPPAPELARRVAELAGGETAVAARAQPGPGPRRLRAARRHVSRRGRPGAAAVAADARSRTAARDSASGCGRCGTRASSSSAAAS